jgi:F0F1-type ATP synthase membrane subunit c/vacuolar-type H+-ATPase subunit K
MTPVRQRQSDQLADIAAVLSPGMAYVLERLVAAYVTGTQLTLTSGENALLIAAGLALGTVNRTPGAAQQIGRDAAHAVSRSPHAMGLLSIATSIQQQLQVLTPPRPHLKLGEPQTKLDGRSTLRNA